MKRGRFVIVEGPDGAGKTTLAQKLSLEFGLTYHHFGPPGPDGAFLEYARFALDNTDVIVDRFHLGERVYGPLVRGVDTLKGPGQDAIEVLIAHLHRPLIVFARAPYHVVESNWAARKGVELLQENVQLKRAWYAYQNISTTLPAYAFNYVFENSYDRVAAHVREL